ncbi:MAG TPA: hypothetical protein VME20_04170 [Acidimicrobiales bacterium]|nr:hypothetical protein [Acidimicrobiales bacterium]
MTVTLTEDRRKSAAAPPPGAATQTGAAPVVEGGFERPEAVLTFFRELLEFLREFSEARPRSRPTSPLTHKARNVAYRAAARTAAKLEPHPAPELSPIDRLEEEADLLPASARRQRAAKGSPVGQTQHRAPAAAGRTARGGALGAPGTAGEIFRRPRSLAGAMPRPEEIVATRSLEEDEPVVEDVREELAIVTEVVPEEEPRPRRKLRVPPFVARL